MNGLLDITGMDAGYGDFQAIFGLDLRVHEGEALAVIGANGAGKTTMLRAICGVVDVFDGSLTFDGADLRSMPAHKRVAAGIAMVPEGRKLFPSLTVRENLQIGGHVDRATSGSWDLDGVLELFPLIVPLLDRPSDVLSGGEKQAVAIGRALMSNPRLLLMDECSLGLAPIIVRDVYAAVPKIRDRGTSLLIVEQDIGQALKVADRVVCFLEGTAVLEGTPDGLTRDEITAAYFGVERATAGEG